MKERSRAKGVAKYYDQCRLPKWVIVLGIVLLAFGIVAAGVAIYDIAQQTEQNRPDEIIRIWGGFSHNPM